MKISSFLLLAAGTVAMSPALAQDVTPAQYVMKAGAGDLYERQSSQVVLQTTTNPDLKTFAQQMIIDHKKSTAMVKAAAARAHVKVAPPMLAPDQADMLTALRAATGPERDATYIAQQKTAHDQALALHQGYAENGTAAPLKAAAGKIAPVVQMHINMLAKM